MAPHLAGESGWPALAKDERIRCHPAERAAVLRHGVRAFHLTSGNLTAAQMADGYIVNQAAIWSHCAAEGPGLFAVTRTTIREEGHRHSAGLGKT